MHERVVRKALCEIATRLHDDPSRSHACFCCTFECRAPVLALVVGLYAGYKSEWGDWPRYSSSREESCWKEFSVPFMCPIANIGGVIRKGGAIINQIRQGTRASIKVDISSAESDDCLVTIVSKEECF